MRPVEYCTGYGTGTIDRYSTRSRYSTCTGTGTVPVDEFESVHVRSTAVPAIVRSTVEL